ncbi:MAG: single-stranded-DNA-specific exonuclease RecJ [Pseudomonadota bacterium]
MAGEDEPGAGAGASLDPALFGVTQSLGGRRWTLTDAREADIQAISRLSGAPDVLARLLAARSIAPEEAKAFLEPRLRDSFPDPSSFADMDAAASLIWDVLEADARIAIFADYDVDGASSAAQLTAWMRLLGHDPIIYVPDRIEEGYGPSAAAFDAMQARGAELIITVDCGAAAHEALRHADARGMPVVVVDHHLMDGPAPPAAALVNPNRSDDRSGCGHMAAAGVTFVLLTALNREGRERGAFETTPEPSLIDFLDLAALGTLCDVVALTGVNRAIAAQGLKVLSQRKRPGIDVLGRIAGWEGPASAYHAGFVLGPRINAGGRVGKADLGARLLTARNDGEAEPAARQLDQLNAERRAIEQDILSAALEMASESMAADPDAPVLILSAEGWHAGVIGIVAGRVKDRFNRPTIVIGADRETGLGKGSGRSCSGVNLGAAVAAAREAGLLTSGGGHAMAAGLSLDMQRLAEFETFMRDALADQWRDAHEARLYTVDAVLSASGVQFELWETLQRAAPFGAGNREPRFAFEALSLTYAEIVGRDHVRFAFQSEAGAALRGIIFRAVENPIGQALLQGKGDRFHAVGRIKGEDGRFGRKAELHLEDLAPVR